MDGVEEAGVSPAGVYPKVVLLADLLGGASISRVVGASLLHPIYPALPPPMLASRQAKPSLCPFSLHISGISLMGVEQSKRIKHYICHIRDFDSLTFTDHSILCQHHASPSSMLQPQPQETNQE